MSEAMEEHLWFNVGEDRCEGILSYPSAGAAQSTMLLLAPHPHFGGNMNNNVLRHVARAVAVDGVMAMRFNYCGIGASTLSKRLGTSVYDHYQHIEEARAYETFVPACTAAWDVLAAASPDACNRMVFGYSLGSLLAARLGAMRRPDHIFALSPPNRRTGLAEYLRCTVPTTFFGGDNDFAFDRAALESDRNNIPAPTRFIELSGADHFFRQEEHLIHEALCATAFYAEHLSIAP